MIAISIEYGAFLISLLTGIVQKTDFDGSQLLTRHT